MKLSSLLNETNILIDPPVETKQEATRRLLDTFEPRLDGPTRDLAFRYLIDREKKISSYVDHGVAIPHAKVEGLDTTLVGLLTSRRGFNAQEPTGATCHLLFLILTPPEKNTLMLQTLAAVARLCHNKDMREALRRTTTPARILRQIEESGIDVKTTITAADLMVPPSTVLHAEMPLHEAIVALIKSREDVLPVADNQGKLLGELTSIEILKIGLPEYVDLLKDDTFLAQFEPFEDYFQREKQLTVRDVMTREILTAEENTPIIKIASLLVANRRPCLYVVRDGLLHALIYRRDLLSRVLHV